LVSLDEQFFSGNVGNVYWEKMAQPHSFGKIAYSWLVFAYNVPEVVVFTVSLSF